MDVMRVSAVVGVLIRRHAAVPVPSPRLLQRYEVPGCDPAPCHNHSQVVPTHVISSSSPPLDPVGNRGR